MLERFILVVCVPLWWLVFLSTGFVVVFFFSSLCFYLCWLIFLFTWCLRGSFSWCVFHSPQRTTNCSASAGLPFLGWCLITIRLTMVMEMMMMEMMMMVNIRIAKPPNPLTQWAAVRTTPSVKIEAPHCAKLLRNYFKLHRKLLWNLPNILHECWTMNVCSPKNPE